MQGLVFEGGRQVALAQFEDPKPGPGQVLLRVTASGMCGSDLHYYRADPAPAEQLGVIGGHEPTGVVAELGAGVDAEHLTVGARVMVHHYAGCRGCAPCRSGWTQMCASGPAVVYGKNAHGAHAPYMVVAAEALLPLPDELSPAAGAAIGCGTGTAWGGLERLGDVGGSFVLVSGQGPVGLSATMLATARGARVIAVDLSQNRLDHAVELGAVAALNPTEVDVAKEVKAMTGGGAPLALETSGSSAAASSGLESLAPWGRMCVVGLGGHVDLDVRRFLSRQLTVMTSWSLSTVQQLQCASFVASRRLPVDSLFSHRWSLDQAQEAYRDFDNQDAGKGVFIFEEADR